jgi:cytosine/adenosine deaminase-related metal-dependent hydrolase
VSLVLHDVRWASRGRTGRGDLRIARGRIAELAGQCAPRRGDIVLELSGRWVLPGLINGHDHLGLNLLPRLGNPPYASFYDWAEEIYRPDESPIADMNRVPMADRLAWGAWRNVFGGATSVAQHDPWRAPPFSFQQISRNFRERAFPVTVVRCAWGHSLGYEPDLPSRYRPDRPFVVHAAEGVDERAHGEVAELERLGLLQANTVLVHAMALSDDDLALLARRRCKVVWCPASNVRLYGQSARVAMLLRAGVTVVLGTDSTLSGGLTLLHELQQAAQTGEASPDELIAMVTHAAATAFGLQDSRGALEPGGRADLIVVPDRGAPSDSLLGALPRDLQLVLAAGRPLLADPELAGALALGPANLTVDNVRRWIDVRFVRLRERIATALGPDYPHGDLWRLVS